MKMFKQLIAAVLALIMLVSLAACGAQKQESTEPAKQETEVSKKEEKVETETPAVEEDKYYNETGYPICDETIQITVSGVANYTNDWEETVMVKYIRDELGIDMVCDPLPADSFSSQYALMLANNEQPDMLINLQNFNKAQSNMDGEAGYWLDLSQYLDIMPNFVKCMEENPAWAAYNKTESGAIYGFNWMTASEVGRIGGMLYVNRAAAESVGYDKDSIKTLDDFYNLLVALKEQYPDEIIFSILPTGVGYSYHGERVLRTSFGINHLGKRYLTELGEDGKAFLHDVTDNYREYLKFMNKLYEEGLLDSECFVRTADEFRTLEYDGEFLVWSDSGINSAHGVPGNWIAVPALTTEEYPESTFVLGTPVKEGVRIMVKADTEYPEAICRLIDYMFTEEGKALAGGYGIEGETFDWVTDKYGITTVSHEKYADLTEFETVHEWTIQNNSIFQGMQFFHGLDRVPFNGVATDVLAAMVDDEEVLIDSRFFAYTGLAIKDVENLVSGQTPVVYSEDETKERATLYTDIDNYLKTMKVSFISGEIDIENDDEWNNYVEQLKKMGYDRLMEIETAAMNRMQ